MYKVSELTPKIAVRTYNNVLSRQSTLLFSKMKKGRRKLECGSQGMQKAFRRRHIKGD